jgi:hypothetical protein
MGFAGAPTGESLKFYRYHFSIVQQWPLQAKSSRPLRKIGGIIFG